MTGTLLLFDLDGTLMNTSAGRTAFNRAFARVYGLERAAGTVKMAGRTDLSIHAELCDVYGLDPATFGVWKLEFLAQLAEAMLADKGTVLPGVIPLLEACAAEPQLTLALGTGNVEEGARIKLAAHDLNRFFPVGGFGADGATRDEVIARGIQRASVLRGRPFDRMVVIGDTPHDIACGKANGCVTVGVATGPHSEEELGACGADVVLPDLAHTAAILRLLHALS